MEQFQHLLPIASPPLMHPKLAEDEIREDHLQIPVLSNFENAPVSQGWRVILERFIMGMNKIGKWAVTQALAAVEYLQNDDNNPGKLDSNKENEPEVHDWPGVWTYEWLAGSRTEMNKIYRFTKQAFDEDLYPLVSAVLKRNEYRRKPIYRFSGKSQMGLVLTWLYKTRDYDILGQNFWLSPERTQ